MKAILVGRHAGNIPNLEIVEQRNVNFALNTSECFRQLEELLLEAHRAGAALVLQNTPGILGAVLYKFAAFLHGCETPFGVIVSIPGERLAGVVKNVITDDPMGVKNAVEFANQRAHVEANQESSLVTITVDPVPHFLFSHIEWLIPPQN